MNVYKIYLSSEYELNIIHNNNHYQSIEKINPSKDLIALAEKTIQKLKPIPFYSRVDIILNNENSPVIMELELIEPELWFRFKVDAAKKLGLLVKEFINTWCIRNFF